jgi:hypothetical protein
MVAAARPSHLCLVFRHQLGCIPSLNRLQLRGIEQAYLAQTCRSGLCRDERKIGPEQDLRRLCVSKTSSRFECLTESLNVSDDGRNAMLLSDAIGLALQVEEPA